MRCAAGDASDAHVTAHNQVDVILKDEAGTLMKNVDVNDVIAVVTHDAVAAADGGVGDGAVVPVVKSVVGEGRIHVAWSGCVDVDWMMLSLMAANGVHVRGSPFRLRNASWFAGSVILGKLSHVIMNSFVAALREWLPGRERFRLLYRSSRDGATPAAFHGLCDGQGGTVTVMVSSSGHTFGGYTEVSWSSPAKRKWVVASDAFLFSIVNPHGDAPTRFPLSSKPHPYAMCHSPCYGPVFGAGADMGVSGDGSSPASVFGSKAEYTYIRNPLGTYKDESGRNRGSTTFTDTTPDSRYPTDGMFKLSEMEVWAVV